MNFFDKLGEIRPNQLITTFGPGAIIDAVNDSLTVLDLSYWGKSNLGKEIYDTRLASYMNVRHFYMPKTGGKQDLPVIAFPYYHVCSNKRCQCLFDMRENFDLETYKENNGQVKCPVCGWNAYPSRFITVCEDGHMDDFPWRWWVHKGKTSCKGTLSLVSNGQTSSLAELTVKCSCGAKRTMAGAMQKENFDGLNCTANHPHRPFLHMKNKTCTKFVIPSQRGASNVYFSVTRSAISIPPWTDPINDIVSENRIVIENYEQDFGEAGLQKSYEKFFAPAYTRKEFDAAYKRLKDNVKEYTELKEMEYKAITHHEDVAYQHNVKYFKAEEESVVESLKPYIMRVIKIQRLREVRVLTGFTRLEAPEPEIDDDGQNHIVKLQCGETDEKWLPAVEINGEGIFIELNKETVATWIQNSKVAERSKMYEGFYAAYCEKRGWQNYKTRDAQYVLLHTLSHILIKEMAIKSGYSSTAIQ
ncbi:MAG: DrmB family protein, partial [Selenomonadaceae bacterium]